MAIRRRQRDPRRLSLGPVLAGYGRQTRGKPCRNGELASADSEGSNMAIARFRRYVAEVCRQHLRLHGGETTTEHAPSPARPHNGDIPRLSRRMRQTLERLLAGDSEKQIAAALSLSPHTVHVYVKALYKSFKVNSRGELLSRFVVVAGNGDAVAR
jgi:DNA-binding NarL/FixJ family response regulator